MAWAAYETCVTEIADHARKLLPADPPPLALGDLSGDFLSRAKKYFRSVLEMDLWDSQENWGHVRSSNRPRNVLIHASGRTDRISQARREEIEGWEDLGVSTHFDSLTVSDDLTRTLSDAVVEELRALVERFYEFKAGRSSHSVDES